MRNIQFTLLFLIYLAASACGQQQISTKDTSMNDIPKEGMEKATLGAGCFWCVEAIYQSLKGVDAVVSGYMGGDVENPSYEAVCSGRTGHAEVCQIIFDPNEISYEEVLEAFWASHDPTTLNKQGADVGTQYRSAIFYHNEVQKKLAETSLEAAQSSGAWNDPVVTEITEASMFYKAEDYHQDYYSTNPNQRYCTYVINPKLEKFKKAFKEKLKEEAK